MKPGDAVIARSNELRGVKRGRLFRRYFLLILALVCGALLISGSIGLYFSYQETQVALASVQREKAVSAAARIEQFIRQIEQQLTYAAMAQLGPGGVEQRRVEFLKLQRQVPAITDIAQIDARGKEQLSVSRLGMDVVDSGADRSGNPAFLGARPDQTWFGPVSFRKETEPYMSIAVRAKGNAGAVTVAEVNLKFIWDVVTRIKIGKKGKAYVVDGSGHLVADPDIGLVLRKSNLSMLQQVQWSLRKDAEESRALVAKNMSGAKVLTAYASIEPLGWKVFVEQSFDEVFETLNAAILRSAALIAAGLLISALVAIWLARSMVHPIRALQEGAARIGAGDLDREIVVSTGDELEALARQFNQMSAQLRESYAGLERKVEERTAELQETLQQQTATAEILKVISGSPTNVQPVLDAIVNSAASLFQPGNAAIIMREGDIVQVRGRSQNWREEGNRQAVAEMYPMPFDPERVMSARVMLERRVVEIPDIEAEGVPEIARKVARAGGYRSLTLVPLIRDGEGIGVISLLNPRPGFRLAGKQLALLQTFSDQAVIAIENVRLFREIQEKSRQLEIANQHKSDFLANMSHELRTPLNAIIGFSEALLEKMFGEVNEKQTDYLKDIHSSGRHLLSLINDILDLSKIEAGRMDLDVAEFDLRSALQNALTLVKERAQRHGIELSLLADDAIGSFRADERKFKQIMLNLLSNAVKFTPEGGKVGVRARAVGDAVEVAVADTGVGISAEDQKSVFDEFKQVGRDYTKKAEGTGLGLALTKRFIELHGGSIRLESSPARGSTFTFSIPRQP
ncbi:MAG: HAMP domain-containing protein [Burkholderiales bacterium]|nr:HAMP domain-containing protein [Burkholderiales bacterium]